MDRFFLVRNLRAKTLFDNFLITSVSSIILIRFFLEFTGYPQLGGGNLHIAHMLWGGIFMTIALLAPVFYLNHSALTFSSIVGGVGFGFFIDELGKFITSDNNYLYESAFSLMYVCFILLYLIFRFIIRNPENSPEEKLMNSLELLKEAVEHRMDSQEKKQALKLLEGFRADDPFRIAFTTILNHTAAHHPEPIGSLRRQIKEFYAHLVKTSWFIAAIIIFFITKSILFVIALFHLFPYLLTKPHLSIAEGAELVSGIVIGVLVTAGILMIRRSRLVGYQLFQRSLLISIFFTQFFLFYFDQLSAVFGLGINLLILIALNYMIVQEKLQRLHSA